MSTWITPDDDLVIDLWPDAPSTAETTVELLAAAQRQCEEFAPAIPLDEAEVQILPAGYRIAVVMQARSIHRSMVAGGGDQIGGDGYTVTVFPMDWNVRNLLRPKTSLRRVL